MHKGKLDIKIIHEDNHLLVVEKPVNILSQGDNTGDRDMLGILKEYVKNKYNKLGNVYMGLVHRLDRPVGGVMVFAKTSKAASRLSDQIRKGELKKTYLAVVHGAPKKEKGHLEHYLLKNKNTNTVKVVSSSISRGKKATLDYTTLSTSRNLSLVKINLITGRPHQIRVQFAETGTPLYGDQKYGRTVNRPGQQIALWSFKIEFSHPTLKQKMQFESLPDDTYPWNSFKGIKWS